MPDEVAAAPDQIADGVSPRVRELYNRWRNGAARRPKVLTLAEAASLLRVSDEAMRQSATLGQAPCQLIGGEWRFIDQALIGWVAAGQSAHRPRGGGRHPLASGVAWTPETDQEAEAFIAEIYARRDLSAVPDEAPP